MKICCDVCGGALVVMAGGKGAVCKTCGMEHSIERVREMLAIDAPVKEEPVSVEIVSAAPIVQAEEPTAVPEIIAVEEPVVTSVPIAEYEPIVQEEKPIEQEEPVVILTTAAAIDPIIIAPPAKEEESDVPAKEEASDDYPIVVTKIAPQSAVAKASAEASEFPYAKWEPVTVPKPTVHSTKHERAVYDRAADAYLNNPRLESLPAQYFESLLVSRFPQFEIYKNVQLEYQFQFDFLFENNGKPLLAIIFCHADDYESTNALIVMNYCKRHNIECLRFFTNFANKPDYVYNRISALPAIRRVK